MHLNIWAYNGSCGLCVIHCAQKSGISITNGKVFLATDIQCYRINNYCMKAILISTGFGPIYGALIGLRPRHAMAGFSAARSHDGASLRKIA